MVGVDDFKRIHRLRPRGWINNNIFPFTSREKIKKGLYNRPGGILFAPRNFYRFLHRYAYL
jgi:hypothetical protein